jgi:hypothetical protein
MKSISIFVIILLMASPMMAQENTPVLPYYQIPDYPESYTAETVVARLIDGLGFRYYWATEGLRQEDLEFKPSEEARTSFHTLEHIYSLSEVVYYPVAQEAIKRGIEKEPMNFEEMRKATLENLKKASDILRTGKVKLEDCKLLFERPDRSSEFPFWNNLNGPIADALWHTGQIVSFRRSSGNPFNSKASLFTGKLRE